MARVAGGGRAGPTGAAKNDGCGIWRRSSTWIENIDGPVVGLRDFDALLT